MRDLDSALDDIIRLRGQLAASSRFRGLAPHVVAATGLMAFALAVWQTSLGDDRLVAWILLAGLCVCMIGTEAILRARKLHPAMAERLLTLTLQRFLPAAAAGAIAGIVVLLRMPDHARLLPGLWQLLIGVGIFAVLGNLPCRMVWAALFYFAAGATSLMLSPDPEIASRWLMGVPFGAGQLLVAGILHLASKEDDLDQER
ncbi:hypothetical protein [Bosea sp. TAB14]|jgi:hypothetical protein|uniref:hypothetical protein n=1 Tax=Bosea sp. TAB14 TaxID=3237481 RepID=UPI003F93B979